jgi:hypothetical protein
VEAQVWLRPVHIGFVVDKVTLGQVFLWELYIYRVTIISPMLHTVSFIYCLQYIILAIDSVIK